MGHAHETQSLKSGEVPAKQLQGHSDSGEKSGTQMNWDGLL